MQQINQRGQGLVEYLILLSLIAATTIGIVTVVGQNIKEQYTKASAAIRGKNSNDIQFTEPTEAATKVRGMNDWDKGTGK